MDTLVVARSEGEFDEARYQQALGGRAVPEVERPLSASELPLVRLSDAPEGPFSD